MNNILLFCFPIWFLAASNYAGMPEDGQIHMYRGLVFLSTTGEIYNTRPSNKIPPLTYERWAVACAAESAVEEEFSQSTSLDKKILFVNNITEQGFNGNSECKKFFKISAAYHSISKEIQFGYEVYYDKKKFQKLQSSSYYNFKTMKQYISSLHTLNGLIQIFKLKDFTLNDDQKTSLNLKWVNRISLEHDFKHWNPSIIRYKMLRNFPDTLRHCDDYHLAEDYFELSSEAVDSFYSKENEQRIFQDLDIQSFQSQTKFKCKPGQERCLRKWQLIPPNQISFDASAPSTCSHLTTVPIWINSVERPLENLRTFLQAMIQELDDNLDIVITTGESLTLPRTDDETPQPIYLHNKDNNTKIPIPSTIHHLIQYKIPNCNENKAICNQAIIIVIHNNPNFDRKKDQLMCPQEKDLCSELEWNRIRVQEQENNPERRILYDNVYCCEATNEIMSKFKIPPAEDGHGQFQLMNLGKFPVFGKDGNMQLRNLREAVVQEIERMKRKEDKDGN